MMMTMKSIFGKVHLDIQYTMTLNFLESNQVRHFAMPHFIWGITIMNFPCDLNFRHLFNDWVPPIIGSILSIKLQCLLV
jgi:hypothetical protein